MKNWQKVLVGAVCGGAIYGLGTAATIWTTYAQPLNALSGVAAMVCTIAVGFTKTS